MTVATVIAVIAGVSLGVTLIVLLVRGIFHLGKLVNRVEHLETRFDTLEGRFDNLETKFDALESKVDARFETLEAKFDARFDAMFTAINELRADVQKTNEAIYETNKILVGLANHTHDADGRTVFTIPQ